ncbi:autotransporter outer membrane beta-barrel domain-containing protein [Limnohabitans sp. DCL3]|uniref:autotransporter family protein n=1 Tax=Limnohabitans sp. DCL3 TaxID=3374103 RepID=UPI003A8A5884
MNRPQPIGFPLSLCAMAIVTLFATSGASAADVVFSGNVSTNETVADGLTGRLQGPTGPVFSGNLTLENSSVVLQINSNTSRVNGIFKAEGAGLGFQIVPETLRSANTGVSTSASSALQVGTLNLNAGEKYGLQLGGSLKNGSTFSLIRANALVTETSALFGIQPTAFGGPESGASALNTEQLPSGNKVSDNSYVIDSKVELIDNRSSSDSSQYWLVKYTANRAQDAYIAKAVDYVGGHFSNSAALKLSSIAYQGRQRGDMVTVIDRLDINDYGFGNTAANLAVQSKRLAPIANNAYVLSALSASDTMKSTTDDRLNTLRGGVVGSAKEAKKSLWLQGFSQLGKQSGFTHESALNSYDGFEAKLMGLTMGFDAPVATGWLGGALSMGSGTISQNDFRSSDSANSNNYQFNFYGTQEFGAAYAEMSMAWGQSDVKGTRATAVGRTAQDAVKLSSSDVRVGAGYRIKFKDGKSVLTPFASLQSARVHQPLRTETGAGDLSLRIEEKNYDRTRGQLGMRYSTESRLLGRPTFLSLQGSVSRDSGLNNMDVQASYTGETADLQFVTKAAPVDRTALHFGASTSMAMSKSSSLQLKFDLEHRRTFNSQGVQVKGLWLF